MKLKEITEAAYHGQEVWVVQAQRGFGSDVPGEQDVIGPFRSEQEAENFANRIAPTHSDEEMYWELAYSSQMVSPDEALKMSS